MGIGFRDSTGFHPTDKRKPVTFTDNFDSRTGKLKIKDITDGDGSRFLVTPPHQGNRVIDTGGNRQLEHIKSLQKKSRLVIPEDRKYCSVCDRKMTPKHHRESSFYKHPSCTSCRNKQEREDINH